MQGALAWRDRLLARVVFVLALAGVLMLAFPVRVAAAFTPPPAHGAVTDTSGHLTAEDDQRLEAHLAGYRARTSNEIGVLLIGSLGGESIDDVAYTTFNTWGVGKKGADNGVLLVIAPNERKMRIETGKGVGDRLTDLQSSRILRERVGPALKENRFVDAIVLGIDAIEAALDGRAPQPITARPTLDAPDGPPRGLGASDNDHPVVLGIALLGALLALGMLPLTFIVMRRAARRRGGGASHSSSSSWSSGSSSSSDSSWSSGSSGGSDFGGGSSGGGSDFGGGSSGGGGSSDSY